MEGMTRVGGALLVLVGYYYSATASAEASSQGVVELYRATVFGRCCLSVALIAFAAAGNSCLGIIALATMNAVGAAAMHYALLRFPAP